MAPPFLVAARPRGHDGRKVGPGGDLRPCQSLLVQARSKGVSLCGVLWAVCAGFITVLAQLRQRQVELQAGVWCQEVVISCVPGVMDVNMCRDALRMLDLSDCRCCDSWGGGITVDTVGQCMESRGCPIRRQFTKTAKMRTMVAAMALAVVWNVSDRCCSASNAPGELAPLV